MVAQSYARLMTLEEFIIQGQNHFKGATGDLSQLLRDIALAAKIISNEVNKAGITNLLGLDGSVNVQGEAVKRLDLFSNDQMIHALSRSGNVCMIVSEENDKPVRTRSSSGKYVVAMDPLDGSSNIDVNVSIGTIFSVFARKSDRADEPNDYDIHQLGTEQIAAGYVLYGSSTTLVYTTGLGVSAFTLDPGLGEFFLSERSIKMPRFGPTYSLNEGHIGQCSPAVQSYLRKCKTPDSFSGKPYNCRYIGSMVSDIHRTLLDGGIFMYPDTQRLPDGKLRLMYECYPMAFIIEQAGGIAVDKNKTRILEIPVRDIHQRSSIFMGSDQNMRDLISMM
ncbi:MAG: class 1 fructose-bisphosphatase [Balneolales bacterium]|nr:class 1 fructose-bisphosphatase [Balneolales bacterium]